MKKLLAIILCVSLIFTLSATAFAIESNSTQNAMSGATFMPNGKASENTVSSNEYDYILMLQNCTEEELSQLGMTKDDAAAIVTFFYDALAERAMQPDEILIGYGYSEEEINTLRAYNRGARLSEEALRGVTGTLTANIKLFNCGTKYATFSYVWQWDTPPVMMLKDAAAMRWLAYDKNGHELDVTKTSTIVNIDYYWRGTYMFSEEGSQEPDLDFNSINVQFKEGTLFDGSPTLGDLAYAKNGSIRVSVQVEDSVNNQINYIKVAALYAHSTFDVDFPSISLSPSGSISISFSGGSSVDKIGGKKVKIGAGSTIVDL